MAVIATRATVFDRPDAGELAAVLRRNVRHLPLLLLIALVIGIHVPTMHFYFFGDDFLVLGDIRTRTFPAYMRDVLLLRDMTPNWRPLTMLAYWGEFKLFGFNALPWRIVNLTFHLATVVVLYALVLSMTKHTLPAIAAAAIFAVSASAVHTVTYITAFPHILSEFFLISSLYTLYRYVESGERRAAWYWASFGLFVAGFLANEGGVVIGAVLLVYYAAASLARRRDPLDFVVKMMPFAAASTLLVGGLAGCGCQGVDGGFYGVGWHMPRETWVYMSRLAYPVGAIPLNPSALEWTWGSIVIACAIFFFVRGPMIARLAAVGMVIGVMPYVPSKMWTATRYTYMSLPFFAILVAIGAGWVHQHAARLWRPGAHVLAAVAVVSVAGLYSWQTIRQTQPFVQETSRWRLLADDLRATYQHVPPGTTIYVVDDQGLWTNPLWQPTWMTSVGRALYGKDVSVRAYTAADLARLQRSLEGEPYLVELQGGHLRQVTPAAVLARSGQRE
ncbi:MAG TPA: hypothetical protein VEZ14_05960 [Dehalococcoidia bacterium]|nr:hypothetical protein [Dehalococcoidia bacterium]